MDETTKKIKSFMREIPLKDRSHDFKIMKEFLKAKKITSTKSKEVKASDYVIVEDILIQDIWSYDGNCGTITYLGRMGFSKCGPRMVIKKPNGAYVKTSIDVDDYAFENGEQVANDFYEKGRPHFVWKCVLRTTRLMEEAKAKAAEDAIGREVEPPNEAFTVWCKDNMRLYGKNYFFYTEGDGYCTSCKKNIPVKIKNRNKMHGQNGICPSCGKKVTYLSRNKCKFNYVDDRFYLKFEAAGENVLARYFIMDRTIKKEDIENPSFNIVERLRFLFKKDSYICMKVVNRGKWNISKDIPLNGHNMYGAGYPMWSGSGAVYRRGLKKIVDNSFLCKTGFQEFLDASKHFNPQYFVTGDVGAYIQYHYKTCVYEWMLKSGFTKLFEDCFIHPTLSNLAYYEFKFNNNKGKTLADALKINKTTYRMLYEHRGECGYKEIICAKAFPNEKFEVIKELANVLGEDVSKFDIDVLQDITAHVSLHKALKYIVFQNKKRNNNGAISIYRDYIRMSVDKGEFDKKNSMIAFPKHLDEEHQRLVEWKNQNNREIRTAELDMIDSLLSEYHKQFDFVKEGEELIVTAPEKGEDIISEGRKQHICVGGMSMPYISQMAHKEGAILFIRKQDTPETPYYTMEVRNGSICQVRGACNCAPSQEVKDFVEEFAKAKNLAVGY